MNKQPTIPTPVVTTVVEHTITTTTKVNLTEDQIKEILLKYYNIEKGHVEFNECSIGGIHGALITETNVTVDYRSINSVVDIDKTETEET